MKNTVMIFAKAPVPGKVKTRLAKDLGNQKAADIYEQVLTGLIKNLSKDKRFTLHIHVSGETKYFKDNFSDVHLEQQEAGDLGMKIEKAFKSELTSSDKVIVIGSDCPDIDCELLARSFDLLETNDVVIGPADDGGYYLLGMAEYTPLFSDIQWGTSTVYDGTIKKIKELQLCFVALEIKPDIDILKDYEFYKKRGMVN